MSSDQLTLHLTRVALALEAGLPVLSRLVRNVLKKRLAAPVVSHPALIIIIITTNPMCTTVTVTIATITAS